MTQTTADSVTAPRHRRRQWSCAIQRLGLLALAVLLQACVTTPTPVEPGSDRPPVSLSHWAAEGKASLSGPEGTETVNLRWERSDSSTESVQLSGPIGLGALELHRRGSELTWLNEGQAQPLARLPLTSTARQAVAELPLGELGNWLLGYPPQNGPWQVTVTQWQGVDSWRLPRKLTLAHPRFTIRLVLLDWQLDATP